MFEQRSVFFVIFLFWHMFFVHPGGLSVYAQEEKNFEAFIEYVGEDHIIAEEQIFSLKMSDVVSENDPRKVVTQFYLVEDGINLSHETLLAVGHITLGRIYLRSGIAYRIDILEMHQ